MAKYSVDRCRIGYASDTIEVEAKNEVDAKRKADDKDFSESEHDADYEYTATLIEGKPEPLDPLDLKYKVAHEPIEAPLTKKQVKAIKDENGFITAVVKVDFNDIIDLDREGFLDLIDEKLLKSGVLSGSNFTVVGFDRDNLTLHIQAHGQVDDY